MLKTPGIEHVTSVLGFSLLSTVQSTFSAFFFITLKPWDERTKPEEQYAALKQKISQELAAIPDGIGFSFPPPVIPGIGTSGGVTFMLEDRAGRDVSFLGDNLTKFLAAVKKRPEIATASTTFLPAVPQVYIDVDRDKVLKEGVDLTQVTQTLQTFMGGFFVNYFNRFDANGRSSSRRRANIALAQKTSGSSLCATRTTTPCRSARSQIFRNAKDRSSPCASIFIAPRRSTPAPRPASARATP